jgi:hypothetical protein
VKRCILTDIPVFGIVVEIGVRGVGTRRVAGLLILMRGYSYQVGIETMLLLPQSWSMGEGEELEDKSHDERLFDVEDGGAGLKKQANKFFDGTNKLFSKKKTESKKQSKATSKDNTSNNSFETESKIDVSDDAFFDALQPPSGRVDAFYGNADTEDSLNTANHPFQHHDNPQTTAGNHQNQNDVQQSRNDDCFNDDMLLDDRGYDEESDLLGLRSDSPPPLDLEEIEKKMLKNMENAKSYY